MIRLIQNIYKSYICLITRKTRTIGRHSTLSHIFLLQTDAELLSNSNVRFYQISTSQIEWDVFRSGENQRTYQEETPWVCGCSDWRRFQILNFPETNPWNWIAGGAAFSWRVVQPWESKRHQQFDTICRRDWVGLISKSGEMRSANPPTDDNRFSCLRNHERLFCRYFQIWRKHLSTSCHEHMETLGDEVEANWAEIIHHHVFDLLTMKICKGSAALCARWDGPQPALCLCDSCMLQQCYVDESPYKDTSKNSAGRFGSCVSQLHAKQSFFVNHVFVLRRCSDGMSICTFNLSTSLDLFRFWGLATRRRSVISPRVNFPCRVTDPVLSDWWIRTFTHIYAETWIIHVIHTLFLAGIKQNCPHNLSTRFYAWNLLNFWRFTEAVLDIQMFNKGRVNTRDMCQ